MLYIKANLLITITLDFMASAYPTLNDASDCLFFCFLEL